MNKILIKLHGPFHAIKNSQKSNASNQSHLNGKKKEEEQICGQGQRKK